MCKYTCKDKIICVCAYVFVCTYFLSCSFMQGTKHCRSIQQHSTVTLPLSCCFLYECSTVILICHFQISYISSHQNVSGYYRVSSYFFAKVLCDLLPIRIIPVAMHITILYWMIGEYYLHVYKTVCVVLRSVMLRTISPYSLFYSMPFIL